MYPPTTPELQNLNALPYSHPTKNKRKENISLIPHRGCLNSWQDMQIIFAKKKYTPANFKAFIQHSRRALSKTKRSREEQGKMLNHSGFPVISVSLQSQNKIQRSFKWICLSSGSFVAQVDDSRNFRTTLVSLYSLITCIHT